jgi:predicted nucleic-acid-binding Zn-ribbon protein
MKTPQIFNFKFNCPKCGNKEYEIGKFVAQKNRWSNLNMQQFTTVSCTRCCFTEIYKVPLREFDEVAKFIKG